MKNDFAGSRDASFPLITNFGHTYTMGVSRITASHNDNRVFITRENEPYVTQGFYPNHGFVFSGAQTFTLGWIAVHSIYAWKNLEAETIQIGKLTNALTLMDCGASNLTTNTSYNTTALLWWSTSNKIKN